MRMRIALAALAAAFGIATALAVVTTIKQVRTANSTLSLVSHT
jgi:predicted outer membrane lipoprotein